jgi:DNA-binding NtrC family response regulator
MDKSKISLLVVDDERGLCAGVQEALRREGYSVDAAKDADEALKRTQEGLYNLIIADMKMPGRSGLELLKEVKARSRDTMFIVMTAFGTVESAVEAMKAGAYDYLTKPLDMQRLRVLVLKALEFQALVAENNELRLRLRKRSEPSPLVGTSEALPRWRDSLTRSRPATSLCSSKVKADGQELVARSIHLKSERRDRRSLPPLRCAPGTPARGRIVWPCKGRVYRRHREQTRTLPARRWGTLLLDEIGDLSPKGQGDLLRVLEDGTFRMVGGTVLVRVNVRVIAATNKKLAEAVAAGKFREDLLYRLQILPICIPPLRERAEDIPLLMEDFLAHFAAKHKRRRKKMSTEAMQVCQRFPGRATCGSCAHDRARCHHQPRRHD